MNAEELAKFQAILDNAERNLEAPHKNFDGKFKFPPTLRTFFSELSLRNKPEELAQVWEMAERIYVEELNNFPGDNLEPEEEVELSGKVINRLVSELLNIDPDIRADLASYAEKSSWLKKDQTKPTK